MVNLQLVLYHPKLISISDKSHFDRFVVDLQLVYIAIINITSSTHNDFYGRLIKIQFIPILKETVLILWHQCTELTINEKHENMQSNLVLEKLENSGAVLRTLLLPKTCVSILIV